ncbi:MAG: lysostaphin resistance A-like protein, partial [Stackebrandtia sp.]
SVRWLLIGVVGGLIATGLKIPLTMAYQALFGTASGPQDSWSELSTGGVGPIIIAFVCLGVATPIGEELFFRGVITSALLRYGPVVGVVGSAVIFAVLHGTSVVIVSALVVGLMAAELRRRSGSIWPAVVLHIVFDLVSSVGLFLVIPAAG